MRPFAKVWLSWKSPLSVLTKCVPLAVGRCLVDSLDNVAEALAIAEGEAF
jgi:hypothetical protein